MLKTLRDNLKKIKPKLRNSFHSKSLLLQNYMGLNAGECPASLEQHRNRNVFIQKQPYGK